MSSLDSPLNRLNLRLIKRWLVRHLLPEALTLHLWRRHTARYPRSASATASDCRVVKITDGIRLDVFWVDPTLGPGPGASLYVQGDEVLRLDCFGNNGLGGHFHINPRQKDFYSTTPARIFFPYGSHEDHIERAAFEVERNLPAFLAMNRDSRVRATELDSLILAELADELRRNMFELLERHREDPKEESALADTFSSV